MCESLAEFRIGTEGDGRPVLMQTKGRTVRSGNA
jgi:hypothetical protein